MHPPSIDAKHYGSADIVARRFPTSARPEKALLRTLTIVRTTSGTGPAILPARIASPRPGTSRLDRLQRQWSDSPNARTTQVILARYSIVAVAAKQLVPQESFMIRHAAWYAKDRPTFYDTIAPRLRAAQQHCRKCQKSGAGCSKRTHIRLTVHRD